MVDARGDGSVLEIVIAFQGKNGGGWFQRYEGALWRTAYPPLPLPTTVYVTGGLHRLHIAYGNDKAAMEFQLLFATFRTREVINNFLDAVTHETPHAEIVVLTMPAICEDKMTKWFEKEINLYKNMPNVFCAEFKKQYRLERQNVGRRVEHTHGDRPAAHVHGDVIHTATREGAQREGYFSSRQLDRSPSTARFKGCRARLLPSHGRRVCEYTRRGDAIHFPTLNPAALVTLLRCFDTTLRRLHPLRKAAETRSLERNASWRQRQRTRRACATQLTATVRRQ